MISKINKSLKSEYGFTGQDLLIAMFVLILFLGLMTAVYVNLSSTSQEIKLTSRATEIGTDFMEYIDELYYDDIDVITDDNPDSDDKNNDGWVCNDEFDDNVSDVNTEIKTYLKENLDDDRFKLYYKVSNSGDESEYQKIVSIKVEFEWKDDTHSVESTFIKEREYIKPQNSPNLSNVDYKPIKCVYDNSISDWKFVSSSDNDPEWYNYENHRWAVAVDKDARFNNDNSLDTWSSVYVWIPRYYINKDNNINFLYKNLSKKIEKNDDNSFRLQVISIDENQYGTGYVEDGYNVLYYSSEDIEGYDTGIWVKVKTDENTNISLVTKSDNPSSGYDISGDDSKLNSLFNGLNCYGTNDDKTYNASNTKIPKLSNN